MSGNNKLVLVDAYAQIYRNFFAIRGLTNERGEPTNALFGVARFLLNLDERLPGEYGAVVFDKGVPRQRLELLPEYKATRPAMPDELRAQVPALREWIQAAGWHLLEYEGREADDLIATAAAERDERETYIVSPDKDLAQLVQPGVWLMIPRKKGNLEPLGVEEVREKWGIPPESVRDYLAILGDASDNILGVPGVGSKTAARLVRQFGSIDAMYARLDEIGSDKLREKLRDAEELLKRNRELIGLDASRPPNWPGLEGLKRNPPDWDRLTKLAADNQFKSLMPAVRKARDAYRNPTLFD